MTFEDHIGQAFANLTERLRGEIDEEVQRRTDAAIAAAVAEHPREPEPVPQPVAESDATERLVHAFDALDRARSLTEILDTVATVADADSGRAEIWLIRDGRPHRWRATHADAAGDDAPPPLEHGIPLTINGATVALLFTEPRTSNDERRTTNAEPGTSNVERRTTSVDLLTRYASRCLEAMTAFRTARALTGANDEAPAPAGNDPHAEAETSARRYARLLVSEIRLYHEAAVIDGRRDRDLATRLGGEIARARTMYEQRVPPDVRARADHFRDELVKTLADGDSSLLEVRS